MKSAQFLRSLVAVLAVLAGACSSSSGPATTAAGGVPTSAGGGGASGTGGAAGGSSVNGGHVSGGHVSGGVETGGVVANGGASASSGAGGSAGTDAGHADVSAGGNGGSATGVGGAASGGVDGGAVGGTGSGGAAKDGGSAGKGGSSGSSGGAGSLGGAGGSDGGSSNGAATIVPDPSWTCGMPDGVPPPTSGTLAFSVSLTVAAIHDVGNTQFGKRRQLDISGGTITGDKLKGTVLTGGLDYELTLSTGAMELEEVLVWKTSDNTTIFTRICGVAAPGDALVRIVPDIEAPTAGSYAWLNTTKLVGTRTVDAAGSKITLDVYDVSKVAATDTKVQLKDPAGVPNVSWDCVTATGTNGSSVFTENVTLGSTVGVSNAKRGSRNIIPITGGTTTGKVAGKILNGGADYQLAATGGSTTLDARYTLSPSDGNFIIVRNCGPMNGLTPVFEAATDGPYAFLTTGKFLSSAPGSGAGGVSITFYERK